MAEGQDGVRWSIKVSKETDLTLRTYLGARGMKKGDLSKFVEEAVRWRILNLTAGGIKGGDASGDFDEPEAGIDGAARKAPAQSIKADHQKAKRKADPSLRSG